MGKGFQMKEFDFNKASSTVVKLMKERGRANGKLTMFYCSTPSIRFQNGASINFRELILDQDVYKGECSEMYELRDVFKDGKLVGHKQRKINQ
jgi:hypothetical protein